MKIPVCLVTGFLGTGKTTVLKNLVERYRKNRIVYLINEFNPRDIDGAIILNESADVVTIPGGSIFCKCLVSQFIGQMKALPNTYPDTEGLVIEASGMADPRVIETMLKETGLDNVYTLSTILTVVEPGSYLKLRHTLPNVIAQVQSADCILLNKTDLYDDSILTETETLLRDANASASVLRTTQGVFDREIFSGEAPNRELSGEYALCKDPHYSSETIMLEEPIDINKLKSMIMARQDDLYRVKGFVTFAGKSHYLDYSSAGLTIQEVTTIPAQHSLVVIYRGTPDTHLLPNRRAIL